MRTSALLVSFLAICVYLQSPQQVQAEGDTFKVGVILPLTGAMAPVGVSLKNSMLLADKERDLDNKVEFIFEDDTFSPKVAVSALNSLLAIHHVDGFIVFGSGSCLATMDEIERRGLPMIAIATTDKVTEGKKNIVRHFLSADSENALMIRESARRGYQTIAVVTSLQDGMLALRDRFIGQTKAKVVINQEILPGDLDFRSIASMVRQRNPSAVYMVLLSPQTGYFARQLRQLGYTGELFAAHPAEDPADVAIAEGALNDTWYVNSDDRGAREFYSRYEKEFGEKAANAAGNGYDSASLMIAGVKSGNAIYYLHHVQNFQGAFGTYSANGRNEFTIPVAVKKISPQGFEYVSGN